MFQNLRSASKLIDLQEAGCGPSVPLHETRSMHWHQRRGKSAASGDNSHPPPASPEAESSGEGP